MDRILLNTEGLPNAAVGVNAEIGQPQRSGPRLWYSSDKTVSIMLFLTFF